MAKTHKIKIMQITHDLNIGGLQRLAVDISKNLDKSKYQVSVCALREGGILEEELQKNDIKVIKLPTTVNGTDYLTFWKLFKILKEEKPDIIHTHNTQPFVEGGIAGKLAGIPVHIHTEHGRLFPDKRRYMFAERVMSYFTDQIVAVSESAKKDLCSYEKISLKKIKVVINGVSEDKFHIKINKEEKKAELGIDKRFNFILGFAGRLSPEKGLFYLIKAMKRLVSEFPDILLLIAGKGALLEELIAETKRLDIEDSVQFLGPRSDMNEIMSILDVFVLPSLREGLPLVLLEAAAAGLPIVATDVGGNHTVVKNGLNGFLVESKDDYSLYKTIKHLIINKDAKMKFGQSSLELFRNNFTVVKMISEYEGIYQDCLSKKMQVVNLNDLCKKSG